MYPVTEVEVHAELPGAAEFWTPEPDDITDEGFGYFRSVWAIVDISEDEAREMLEKDRAAALFTSGLASTGQEFDAIANVIETGAADDVEGISGDMLAALSPYISDDEDDPLPLDGLEVGVAGLVYTLSAAGIYPAASCRGHPGKHAWSDLPVAIIAVDRCRAHVLTPLVKDAGCGFDIDPARPELLAIYSRSIECTLILAEAVINSLPQFRSCDEDATQPSASSDSTVQPSLFDEDT
jgi:hypothetical protein